LPNESFHRVQGQPLMFLVINKNLSKLFSKKQNKQKKDKTELNSKSSRPQKKAKKKQVSMYSNGKDEK